MTAQVPPSRLILPGRSNTAVNAAATLETPPAIAAKEKPLGEGPTVINGQVRQHTALYDCSVMGNTIV